MNEIFNYIFHPYYDVETIKNAKKIFSTIIIVLLIDLFISYVCLKIQIKTNLAELISHNDNNLTTSQYTLLQFIIMGIAEELIFRAPLKYKSYILPIFSFFLVVFALTTLRNILGLEHIFIKTMVFIVPLITSFFLWLFLRKKDSFNHKLNSFWEKKFKYIFYGSAIIFAYIHAIEFNITTTIGFLIALAFHIPHFISALLLGYTRMRIGIWAAATTHILFNISIDYAWDFFEYLSSLI